MSLLSSDARHNFGCCAALTLSNVLKEANSGKSDNHHLIWQERSRRLPGIVYTNKLSMPGTVLGCRGQTGGSAVKLTLPPAKTGGFASGLHIRNGSSSFYQALFRRLFAGLSQNHHQGPRGQFHCLVGWVLVSQGGPWHFQCTRSDRAWGNALRELL